MPTRHIKLTDHLDQFVQASVEAGRFSDASEVVREGLHLLERREQEDRAKVEWLRAAAAEGASDIERGAYDTLNSSEDLENYIQDLRAEAAEG
jgi:antitoxin ParD1/3/4